ncbi:hypothetical protein HAX54_048820 [Datura stramonium]|uniref:Uncharacterized protein n=1 Tax=Datura stramonium TaxID=4076 RepID=A0ABS8SUT1_DATST|nr:hypothetical protein [Datura stramonium]
MTYKCSLDFRKSVGFSFGISNYSFLSIHLLKWPIFLYSSSSVPNFLPTIVPKIPLSKPSSLYSSTYSVVSPSITLQALISYPIARPKLKVNHYCQEEQWRNTLKWRL